MGSHRATMSPDTLVSMLQPLYNLIEDQDTREKVEETARLYFANTSGNGSVTVNLIPTVVIGLLLLIGLLKLLGLPILASFGLDGLGGDTSGSGYGAPSGGYGTPSSGYDSYARSGDYFDATVADLQDQINQLIASNEALLIKFTMELLELPPMLEQDLPATSLLHLRKKEIKPPDSLTDSGLYGQFWEVLVVVKCKEGNIKTNRNREN